MNDQAQSTSANLDSAAWELIVDTVIPVAWWVAIDDGQSEVDAANVCYATLLTVIDRLKTAGEGPMRAPLRAMVHDIALIECARLAALSRHRTIDLREPQPETARNEGSYGD